MDISVPIVLGSIWIFCMLFIFFLEPQLKKHEHLKISGFKKLKEHFSKMSKADQSQYKSALKQIRINLIDSEYGILALREVELAQKLFAMREMPKNSKVKNMRGFLENEIEITEGAQKVVAMISGE